MMKKAKFSSNSAEGGTCGNGLFCYGVIAALLAGAVACGNRTKPTPRSADNRPARDSIHSTPRPPRIHEAKAATPCGPRPSGIERLINTGTVTIFGEIHGTNEAPKFVEDVACHASRLAPIIVGLEIHSELAARLDTFLMSDGKLTARQALLADRFWTFRDGRGSFAMFRLLEALRQLRRGGRKLRVVAFDGGYDRGGDRDAGMAATIVRQIPKDEAARSIVLLLVGNLHARTDGAQSMAWHLRLAFPAITSLNIAHSAGSAWMCTLERPKQEGKRPHVACGAKGVSGQALGSLRFVKLHGADEGNGYNGISVGRVTASRPAGLETH